MKDFIHPGAKVYSSSTIGFGVIILKRIFNNSIVGPFSIIVAMIIGARNLIGKGIDNLYSQRCEGIFHLSELSSIAEGVCYSMIGMKSFVKRDVEPVVIFL